MNYHDIIEKKIIGPDEAVKVIEGWRTSPCKVVFTNGCFDLLHLGHVEYLSKAASFGDFLIIGLNTDASVSRIKGKTRPINDEKSRAMVLASLAFVSMVVLFSDDTPYELIKTLQPDILVKGADYKAEEIVGHDVVTGRGGNVLTIDLVSGYSTSAIEKRIVNAYLSQK